VARTGVEVLRRRASSVGTRTGEWRADRPFNNEDGIKVMLKAQKGITPKNRLAVPMRFQCPPTGEFSREWAHEWSKFSTLRLGQRSRPMGRPLKTWAISTLLLDGPASDDADFVIWEDPNSDPQRFIAELATLVGDVEELEKPEPVPFRLTMTQMGLWPGVWLVNSIATLTSVRATQRPGEIGVEYLDLTFDEYDQLEVDRKLRADERDQARTHRLRSDDTLHELSKRYYRSASFWREIAKANGIRGVSPGSATELDEWASKHHKRELEIPPSASGGPGSVTKR
jgi:hypothetical protein